MKPGRRNVMQAMLAGGFTGAVGLPQPSFAAERTAPRTTVLLQAGRKPTQASRPGRSGPRLPWTVRRPARSSWAAAAFSIRPACTSSSQRIGVRV